MGGAMMACRIVGQVARAPVPSTSKFTGTSRHASTGSPSPSSTSSMMDVTRASALGSRGRKNAPTANGSPPLRIAAEETRGDLGEDAGAVARAVARRGAAVCDAGQRLEGQAHHVVRALSRRPRHEPHAARVLLAPRVEVGRTAVGPARSLGLRHRRSFPRSSQKKGPLGGERAGGFVSVVYTLTPPVRSRLGE